MILDVLPALLFPIAGDLPVPLRYADGHGLHSFPSIKATPNPARKSKHRADTHQIPFLDQTLNFRYTEFLVTKLFRDIPQGQPTRIR